MSQPIESVPHKYRKLPVVILAMRWTGRNITPIGIFLNKDFPISFNEKGQLDIHTLEGTMLANPGDYIIKGVKGEFYPCKPDIFEATYEPVSDALPRS